MSLERNKGHPGEQAAREVARSLLKTRLPFLDPVRSFPDRSGVGEHPSVFTVYTINILLQESYLPAASHEAFEINPIARQHFNALRSSLVQLAWSGKVDRVSFQDGARAIGDLIDYLRFDESLLKLAINPEVAAAANVLDRHLPEILSSSASREDPHRADELERALIESEATPNAIDAQQAEALKAYQWCRLARLALERILAGIQEITSLIYPEPPQISR